MSRFEPTHFGTALDRRSFSPQSSHTHRPTDRSIDRPINRLDASEHPSLRAFAPRSTVAHTRVSECAHTLRETRVAPSTRSCSNTKLGIMRVKASVARDDASAKRRLADAPTKTGTTAASRTDATSKSAATASTKDELVSSRYNYSSSGGRSKLQLECSDGRVFDVTHEEAMMSSTLWMLLQGAH